MRNKENRSFFFLYYSIKYFTDANTHMKKMKYCLFLILFNYCVSAQEIHIFEHEFCSIGSQRANMVSCNTIARWISTSDSYSFSVFYAKRENSKETLGYSMIFLLTSSMLHHVVIVSIFKLLIMDVE